MLRGGFSFLWPTLNPHERLEAQPESFVNIPQAETRKPSLIRLLMEHYVSST